MITSVELQIISKILTSDNEEEVDRLCEFDTSYYSVFQDQIQFIFDHKSRTGKVPDVFTFQAEFPDINLVKVNEPIDYLVSRIRKNKQQIILVQMFNKIKDLGSGDVTEAWNYISSQCTVALDLSASRPLDLVKQSKQRSEQVVEFSKQHRIPTGFPEIDKLMYGGLSTVEELCLIVARTNTGKSWVCTKMMETAQKNGFPTLYYSPEMQGPFLGTRFDTWRGHFQNSQLQQGKYTEDYSNYIDVLSDDPTSAYVIEDKDMESGHVSVSGLDNLVKRYGIKLLIIDGLSYMTDDKRADTDYIRYKNICNDLFRLSKQRGCAVVVAMQANRETRENKDDKGEGFPNLYNVEGSDHPGRICTQAFILRQVFDKHVLDIKLEKSRNANNQKPVLSYAWDVNTGNVQYIPDRDSYDSSQPSSVIVSGLVSTAESISADLMDDDDFEDVEF